jgi:hypothetical protein
MRLKLARLEDLLFGEILETRAVTRPCELDQNQEFTTDRRLTLSLNKIRWAASLDVEARDE